MGASGALPPLVRLAAQDIVTSLAQWLNINEPMVVVEVGAGIIRSDDPPIYTALLQNQLARLIAFEGDTRHHPKIRAAYGDQATIVSEFLADGTIRTVYIAADSSGMTSLLKPHAQALKFFNGFEHFARIEKQERVQTRRLNDISEIARIDFLKMDIQGSELCVLQHGLEKLAHCLAVQLEVSYICLYEQQPSFGEVDLWMRAHGFVPHCFLDIKKWVIAPTVFNHDLSNPGHQLLESDIVYIRDPLNLAILSDLELKRFALFAHYCVRSVDLCNYLILALVARGACDASVLQLYIASVANGSPQPAAATR